VIAAFAQTPPPATPPAKPEAEVLSELEERASVRRFSAGITASFTPLQAIRSTEQSRSEPVGPAEFRSKTDPDEKYKGFGLTMQVAVTGKFAFNASAIARKRSFENLTVKLVGVDNVSTPFLDERIGTNYTTKTRMRFIDMPLMVRFYSKDRFDEGLRFFVEAGPTIRKVTQLRSHTDILFSDQTTSANDDKPSHRNNALGYTVGAGAQVIDPLGIRVIPHFRYTYWNTLSFDSFLVKGVKKQIEILLTFTF
jgi:opacity protein-like surface antigen